MKIVNTSYLTIMVLFVALAWSANTHANGGSQFGVLWGFSVPDADNTQPYRLFGVKGAAFITPAVSLGGYYLLSDKSGEPPNGEKFSYSLHGVDTAYHIPNQGGETVIALRVGMTKVRMSPGGEDLVYSPYHYGMSVGYDWYMFSRFSIGFEGSYIHVLKGKTTTGTGYLEQEAFNLMNFMLAIQFRL